MSATGTSVSLPDLTTPRARLLLVLADDELISGHRASHWTGVAPSLEEDLAFSTIAQDEINHADLWYQVLLGEDRPDMRAGVDALGLGREPDAYLHAIVCERPPHDFAYTLARHWAYDRFDVIRLAALADSSDGAISAVARKLLHEERYHLEHADYWFGRLADGGDEARRRLHDALAQVLPEALGLFESFDGEDVAVGAGLLPVPHAELRVRWAEIVGGMLDGSGMGDLLPAVDAAAPDEASGGRHGRHSSDFTDDVWPEMTALHRAYPGATW
ncbi:MAG TPA: 1,2-phenylacetyl-CoA epoxidase subunit PaaC [Egicoccus sp.]|nr:1,2-phenylacetyl-CoA epoxidase subunit PaaC [Egicoccus sp.]HSK23640.1 1,2-phenylacetyl-CoA epoxidase subunit PaaC [Egicoccus sp.]